MATLTTTSTPATAAAQATAAAASRSQQRVQRRNDRVLLPPTTLLRSPPFPSLFQVSLHKIPSHLKDEVKLVFPEIIETLQHHHNNTTTTTATTDDSKRLMLAIPTIHTCRFNVLEREEKTEMERNRIFARFSHFANIYKTLLTRIDSGAFVDFVDIDGGASTTAGGQAIFDEVMSCKALLGYKLTRYCGVTMAVHPAAGWKTLALHTIVVCGKSKEVVAVLQEMINSYTISVDGRSGEYIL